VKTSTAQERTKGHKRRRPYSGLVLFRLRVRRRFNLTYPTAASYGFVVIGRLAHGHRPIPTPGSAAKKPLSSTSKPNCGLKPSGRMRAAGSKKIGSPDRSSPSSNANPDQGVCRSGLRSALT